MPRILLVYQLINISIKCQNANRRQNRKTTMKELLRTIVDRATSMNQAARRSGISQGTLSEYCSGKVVPGLEKYVDLCRAMGCRPGWELDNYLGYAGRPYKTAEEALGPVQQLSIAEQQRLISLLSGKYAASLLGIIDKDVIA